MPRFYFHLHNSIEVPDEDGMEMASVDHAKEEATRAARAIMAEDIRAIGQITLSHHIRITNELGEDEMVLPFRACVEVHP